MPQGYINLFRFIASHIDRLLETQDNDSGLKPFLSREMNLWGFIGEVKDGIAYLKPAKKVTGSKVEVL